MVVEDDPEIRAATVRLLAGTGYQVCEADNGAHGLEAALAVRPDLILSDVAMPELDGIELCRRVRAHPDLKDVLFVFLSSIRTKPDEQADGLDVGADSYIARPVSNRELLSRVSAMMRILDATARAKETAITLDAIMESTADFIWAVDPEHFGLLTFNRGLRDYFLKDRGITIQFGHRPEDLFPAGDFVQRWREMYTRTLLQGPHTTEYIVYAGTRTLRLSFSLMTRDGRVFGISVFGHDITEQRQSERALWESEARYRSIFEGAVEGIYQTSLEGKSLAANPALATMLGYELNHGAISEIVDSGHQVWADPDGRVRFTQLVLEKGVVRGYECQFVRKDGRKIWVSLNGLAVRGRDGQATHFQGFIEDITARKQAEEEKHLLQAQLVQAQKMESVGRLAGGVAHDFNNNLAVIMGHVEMALDQLDPAEPIHTDLEQIRKATQRSADLTRQLLAFARKQTVAPKVLNLNEAVAGVLKMLRRLLGEDIDLDWQPGADLWLIKVDPSQIDQILVNLCVNARDAISDVGRLTIETGNCALDADFVATHAGAVPGEYVRLAVTDSGCGMDHETQAHLFEPFFTTKGLGKGTGLGLATVYGSVKQNSGFIDFHSEIGQGTTFTIYLPRHMRVVEEQPERAAQSGEHGRATILLVEDEPAVLRIAKTMVERLGYTVLTAGSAGEAMRVAREHKGPIHLLMTDVIMPDMNGRDLATDLQSVSPETKCLFMSGYTADVIADHGILNEGVAFIQKPFSAGELGAKVRQLLKDQTGS